MTEIKRQTSEAPQSQIRTSDFTGRVLDKYVLIRRLGRGGMADVYLAQQTKLNRPVALKILRPDLARQRAYVERFHREAQAAAALIQANIVQIYEVGEIDGLHFIAQEYVQGQNLRQYLNRYQIVEPILAVNIIRQVAAALQKACEQGVIHRDIKPENIMLAPNGEVKVTDFGLARVMGDSRTDLTQIGITMGTPLYMSPEQAEGSRVDARSDIYSLGITAYHMLAGRPPYEADNALAIAVQHVKQDPEPLDTLRPDLPQELCAIVHKMMAKNPDDRYAEPAQLLKELRKLEFDDITDWEQLTEKLAVENTAVFNDASTIPHSRLEVTRQLETLMMGHFRPWWQSSTLWVSILLMIILGGLVGALHALNNPPPDPLAVTVVDKDKVPKKDNAEQQYSHAFFNERDSTDAEIILSEHLWLAVEEYFPEFDPLTGETNVINQLYIRKAQERLGGFYLRTAQFEQALNCYTRLYELEEQETRLRLVGLAGQTVVYALKDEIPRAEENLAKLQGEVDNLKNDYLRTEITNLLERYGYRSDF